MDNQEVLFGLDNTEPNGVPAPGIPAEVDLLRLRRVADYQAKAVTKRSDLKSNLAALNGGLFQIAISLEGLIKRAAASASESAERQDRMFKSIDVLLRVERQIGRFSEIELRPKSSRRSKIVNVEITDNPIVAVESTETESNEVQS
jgi:hypothetical protein